MKDVATIEQALESASEEADACERRAKGHLRRGEVDLARAEFGRRVLLDRRAQHLQQLLGRLILDHRVA